MSLNITQGQLTRDENQDIDLIRLAGELIDHRIFIICITAVFFIFSLSYALFSSPVYVADAMVQVEKNQGNNLLAGLKSFDSIASPGTAPEIQLLKSRMILGKTVNDLDLRYVVTPRYFPVFGKGWARLTGETPGVLTITHLALPQKAGKYPVLTLTVEKDGRYLIEGTDISAQGQVGQMLSQKDVSLMLSQMEAQPGTRFTLTLLDELQAINDLSQRFNVVEKSSDSGMLNLTLSGGDPAMIARVLKNITDNYVQQNIEREAAQDSKSLAFLERQLPGVRTELDLAEERLNAYRKKRDSVDLNLEAKSVLDQIVNLDNQLNELTFREAEISQLYKKGHPTYRALVEKQQTLEKEKVRLNRRVSAMPSTQQEIIRLSRDVDSGRAIYLQLLTRQQELGISKSSATGNVRVIDVAATGPAPVKPKGMQIVVIGFLSGLMCACGIVILRSLLRKGIETPEQLEEQGINVYATLPHSEWLIRKTRLRTYPLSGRRGKHKTENVPFLPVVRPMDIFVESIRGLRTSLHFAMMDADNNNLMITSPGEDCGKTLVSSSLAAIVAQTGKKVLFIDADMRRGYAHNVFGLDNTSGLSQVLAGKVVCGEAVQHYSDGGFDVLPCGQIPPNPSELLMHDRFRQLMQWAGARYDMVIVDTPPVLAVTDASLAGRCCGSTLLVARFGVTSAKEVQVCTRRLQQAGITIKGAILNGVIKRAATLYSAGYDYCSYGYADASTVEGTAKGKPSGR